MMKELSYKFMVACTLLFVISTIATAMFLYMRIASGVTDSAAESQLSKSALYISAAGMALSAVGWLTSMILYRIEEVNEK